MHYYVADTETTSAKPTAGVVEVGWIKIDEDFNILEQHESLIDPGQPISPSASGIHGLVYEDVKDSPTLAEYFSEPTCFGRKLAGPAALIGHRISFDRQFLEPYIEGPIYELDTLRWVRNLHPEAEDHKLSTCKYLFNLPRGGVAHRVMSDVMDAYWLLRYIADSTRMSLPQLVENSQGPLTVHFMPFGKHKGETIDKVPVGYIKWALREMELDIDLKHALTARARGDA